MKPATRLPRLFQLMLASTGLLLLAGCATSSFHAGPAPSLQPGATWVVAPLINNTATPYAGQRAEHMVAALLSQRGAGQILSAPQEASASGLPLDNGQSSVQDARTYATKSNARYLVTGSVNEWTYKIGLDGQPAVGFTLSVTDVPSGQILWTGAASASGSSREGAAVLAQDTLDNLVNRLAAH